MSSTVLLERIWRSDLLDSTERFRLEQSNDGFRLSGTVSIDRRGAHVGITYEVDNTTDWRTRRAVIRIPDVQVEFDVTVEGSASWSINGRRRSDLRGCIDIDLGWTPATNTLPIRRTRAPIGSPTEVRAAWLQWPELDFIAATQTYTKQDEGTWLYESGDFSAVLEVDPHGAVVTYGDPPIWYSVSGHPGGEEA